MGLAQARPNKYVGELTLVPHSGYSCSDELFSYNVHYVTMENIELFPGAIVAGPLDFNVKVAR